MRTLKFVPHIDLTFIDPTWTPLYITRNHAMMVFDTLYGTDIAGNVHPQMVDGHVVEDDGRTWRMTLRDGLKFHDGTPVLAKDCVSSIKRWARRDNYGLSVMAVTDELSALDDRTIQFRLKRPFPLLSAALGKGGSPICGMMPARLADSDPSKPISEAIGSGPYRFVASERLAGARVVYARNPDYVPRATGTPSFTAGPKFVHFDRVEWMIIPDPSTAAAALQAGEVDWLELPTADLLPILKANQRLAVVLHDRTGFIGNMRLNHLTPPFDSPVIRRALLGAISQDDYMAATGGSDPTLHRTGVGFFCPESPMASDAGITAIPEKPDYAGVRQTISDAGYNGQKIVLIGASDAVAAKAMTDVGADMLSRIGFNVETSFMDAGAMLPRLLRTEPTEQGGWNVVYTYWSGLDQWDPAGHTYLRANGRAGRPGWPQSARLEALREDWLAALTLAEQRRIARDIQLQAFQDIPYIPLGQWFAPMAYKRELTGVLDGYALFWNVRRG